MKNEFFFTVAIHPPMKQRLRRNLVKMSSNCLLA